MIRYKLSRKIALPILSAMLLPLSGHPSPAQSPRLLASQGVPGQVMETIAPAATVISTRHYQVWRELTCGGSGCNGFFPRPGSKRRLNATRVSCYIYGESTFRSGGIGVYRADYSLVVGQYLPTVHSSPNHFHTLNQAMCRSPASNASSLNCC
jgi:hypothetical protein